VCLPWLFERFAAEIQGELSRMPAEPPVANLPKKRCEKGLQKSIALLLFLTAETPNRSQKVS